MLGSLALLVLVGFCWGGTNPLLRTGAQGMQAIREPTVGRQWLAELTYLATRWQFTIPFVLNQSGSVLFLWALAGAHVSVCVPVANSCSFVFASLVSWLLGEQPLNARSVLGLLCVLVGVCLCVLSRAAD